MGGTFGRDSKMTFKHVGRHVEFQEYMVFFSMGAVPFAPFFGQLWRRARVRLHEMAAGQWMVFVILIFLVGSGLTHTTRSILSLSRRAHAPCPGHGAR